MGIYDEASLIKVAIVYAARVGTGGRSSGMNLVEGC